MCKINYKFWMGSSKTLLSQFDYHGFTNFILLEMISEKSIIFNNLKVYHHLFLFEVLLGVIKLV